MVQLAVRDAGVDVTFTTGAAATFTCTVMETDTPVPVNAMVPVYTAAVVNDAVFSVTDKLPGFEALALRLLADSPIHDWLAFAVSDTAAVDAVLN